MGEMLGITKVVLMVVASAAAWNDLMRRKVPNRLVYPVMLAGVLVAGLSGGGPGIRESALGLGVPLVLFPFFAMRMLGAGDIKLLMALGAWLGLMGSVELMLWSVMLGGIVAAGMMLIHRNGPKRMARFWEYLKACLLSVRLLPYEDFSRIEAGAALPFAIAVLGGMVCLIAQEYGLLPALLR